MFAGSLTYSIKSSKPEDIVPHLFMGLDKSFSKKVKCDDIIIGGDNFGCGSSREHPAVGLAHLGVKAVIVKSVARIFFRSSLNQGMFIIVSPEAVNSYKQGMKVDVNYTEGKIYIGDKIISIPPLPDKLLDIIKAGGLKKLLSKTI